MQTFDPYTHTFDPKTDPLTADQQAIAMVDELERSRVLRGRAKADPDDVKEILTRGMTPDEAAGVEVPDFRQLDTNLASYLDYKKARGEDPLSYEPEAVARSKGKSTQELAVKLKDLFTADEATFRSFLREQGDEKDFDEFDRYMPTGTSMKPIYLKEKAMEMMGFSAREIASGFAEPQFREIIGAGEHQPTEEAAKEWALHQTNEFDRRTAIAETAETAAYTNWLGMTEGQEAFEKELEAAHPDLTDTERETIRRIENVINEGMEEKYGHLKDPVKRVFNTVASQSGTGSKFDDQPFLFDSLDQAAEELAKYGRKDLDIITAMLAQTAKAHGERVDGFMNRVVENIDRSIVHQLGGMAIRGGDVGRVNDALRKLKGERELFIPSGISEDEKLKFILSGETLLDVQRPMFGPASRDKKDPRGFYDRRTITPAEREELLEQLEPIELQLAYRTKLANWKDSVATLKRENAYHPENWVYYAIDSLPQMALSMHPATLGIVASAQTERNMADLREQAPDGDWEQMGQGPSIAGYGYAAMARIQAQVMFGKIPGVSKLLASKSMGVKFAGHVAVRFPPEVAIELGQEGLAPTTQKIYAQFDEAMPDVELFGKDGRLTELIKSTPEIAFAMIPLVLMGVAGRMSLDVLDRGALSRVMNDTDFLAEFGLNEAEIKLMDGMTLDEKADFVHNRFNEGTTLDSGQTEIFSNVAQQNPTGADITANPDGGFTVSMSGTSLQARTSTEAAEAARTLDPVGYKRAHRPVKAPFTPEQKANFTLERTIRPGDPEITVSNSFLLPFMSRPLAGLTQEPRFRIEQGLPPIADPDGRIGAMARYRYGLQTWASAQRPIKGIRKIQDSKNRKLAAVEGQFNEIAKQFDHLVHKHLQKQNPAMWESNYLEIQRDAYFALRGDEASMNRLPKKVRKVAQQGRDAIDFYSQQVIASNAINRDLANVLGDNIGAYITRHFKAHDSKSGWNYHHVKKNEPEIYANAQRYFMGKQKRGAEEGVMNSAKDADGIIREMLDNDIDARANAYMGNNDKVDTTNFITKQDLDPAILALLGEVKNPAQNILQSGRKVSRIAIINDAQNALAEFLIQNKLASRKPNPDLKHFEKNRLGAERVPFAAIDPETGEPIVRYTTRTKAAFAGFGELYVETELYSHLTQLFDTTPRQISSFQQGFDQLAKLTAISKFGQVVLNPPAYFTNTVSGGWQELLNGRVSFAGARAYFMPGSLKTVGQDPKTPYGPNEQAAVYEMTTKEWDAQVGTLRMSRNFISGEMEYAGLRNVNVFANDLKNTYELAYGEGKGSSFMQLMGRAYQAPDNAAKRNAWAYELNKYVKAYPEWTMRQAIQAANEDVRATTQNYDLVPQVIREYSQRGILVPTYISFSYELYRNSIGTARLAWREIRSDNATIRRHGYQRMAGMIAVATASYSVMQLSANAVGGGSDEGNMHELLDVVLPPWMKGRLVGYLRADDQEIRFFDTSYFIPHMQIFDLVNVANNARKEEDIPGMITRPIWELASQFTDLNIATNTAAELITGTKTSGAPIVNEHDDWWDATKKRAAHVRDRMGTTGVERMYDKYQRAKKGEAGYMGTTARYEDLWWGLLGIRPITIDTSSEEFLVNNLSSYRIRDSKIRRGMTAGREERLLASASTPEEREKIEADIQRERGKIESAQADVQQEFEKFIALCRALGVEESRINKAMRDAKLSRRTFRLPPNTTHRTSLSAD